MPLRKFVPALLLVSSLFLERGAHAAESHPAHTGFQGSLQMGLSYPLGQATAAPGDKLANRYGSQWQPFLLGFGAKVSEHVYVGGYVDATFGSKGRDTEVKSACRDADNNLENDIGCSSFTVRAGLETRYSFTPAQVTDFWLGYGIGPTLASETIKDRVIDRKETTQVTGWEFVRLSAGATFRLTKGFGFGPYILGSLGHYFHETTRVQKVTVYQGRIEDRAWHVWMGLGLRLVVLP